MDHGTDNVGVPFIADVLPAVVLTTIQLGRDSALSPWWFYLIATIPLSIPSSSWAWCLNLAACKGPIRECFWSLWHWKANLPTFYFPNSSKAYRFTAQSNSSLFIDDVSFWDQYPEGSFVRDHWVVCTFAFVVMSISSASVVNTVAHSRFLSLWVVGPFMRYVGMRSPAMLALCLSSAQASTPRGGSATQPAVVLNFVLSLLCAVRAVELLPQCTHRPFELATLRATRCFLAAAERACAALAAWLSRLGQAASSAGRFAAQVASSCARRLWLEASWLGRFAVSLWNLGRRFFALASSAVAARIRAVGALVGRAAAALGVRASAWALQVANFTARGARLAVEKLRLRELAHFLARSLTFLQRAVGCAAERVAAEALERAIVFAAALASASRAVASLVKRAGRSAWSALSRFFHSAWTACARFLHSAWTACVRFFHSAWTACVRFLHSVWTALSRFLHSAWSALSRFLHSAWTACVRFLHSVWQLAQRVEARIQALCTKAGALLQRGFAAARAKLCFWGSKVRLWWRSAMSALSHACSAVQSAAAAAWTRFAALRTAFRALSSRAAGWLLAAKQAAAALGRRASAAWAAAARAVSAVASRAASAVAWACREVVCALGSRLLKACAVAGERVRAALWRAGRAVGQAVWREVVSPALELFGFGFGHFTKAWWRLLPALLAARACTLFALAPFSSPSSATAAGATLAAAAADAASQAALAVNGHHAEVFAEPSAVLGFVLASWATGILALVLAKDWHARTFHWSSRSNRQFVATSAASVYFDPSSAVDRALLHVDLGAVRGATSAGAAAWHGGCTFVSWAASAGARAARLVGKVVKAAWRWVLLPLLTKLAQAVKVVWNSPVLCSSSTLGFVYLLWAHHSGQWRWEKLESCVVWAQENAWEVAVRGAWLGWQLARAAAGVAAEAARVAVQVAWAVLRTTREQLEAACANGDLVGSPRLAWVAWLVVVAACKAQPEVRIKALSWPFVLLWATALAGGARHLSAVLLCVLCWNGAGAWVRRYEQAQRVRVAESVERRRLHRYRRRRSRPQRHLQEEDEGEEEEVQEGREPERKEAFRRPLESGGGGGGGWDGGSNSRSRSNGSAVRRRRGANTDAGGQGPRSSPPLPPLPRVPTAAAAAAAAAPSPRCVPCKPERPVKFAEQTECAVCLEELALKPDGTAYESASSAKEGTGTLPCNHRFHATCINEWLERESRCPVCRQAAGGIDRMLEIVF